MQRSPYPMGIFACFLIFVPGLWASQRAGAEPAAVLVETGPQPSESIDAQKAGGESAAEVRHLRPASVFQDHMVLQRGRENPVFGRGIPGAEIVLRVQGGERRGKERRGKVGADGRWKLALPELKAGGPYEIELKSAGEALRFQDVLVGEVWLCSGQSNMQFGLQRA
ncbi:MAG TPA: hypothetical protein ENK02_10135, partial [Planctomycetes bacterium]|nr:hypothetical protein [Planctomycetota bacterium]